MMSIYFKLDALRELKKTHDSNCLDGNIVLT